jgi:hypothetical protein
VLATRVPFLLLAVVAGCRVGGAEPIPFRGAAPKTILVWPVVDEPFTDWQPTLLTGLDVAVRRRGYVVVASAVARQLLGDAGLSLDAVHGEQVHGATGADAVLRLIVHEFRAQGERLQRADWDLAWELTATVDGAVLWQFSHHGHWERRVPIEAHPHPRTEEDQPPVLFGDREPDFRDASDLAAWLHRFAMERLPRGPR